jgi:uncharacterized protein YjbI with pentapeptide repeats
LGHRSERAGFGSIPMSSQDPNTSASPAEAAEPSALSQLFGAGEAAAEVDAEYDPRDVLELLREGRTVSADKRTLAGRRLVAEDLSGLNLSGWDLCGADLSRADLSGATLVKAQLTETILYEVDLSHSECLGACFDGANLTGANLSGSGLGNASFVGALMVDARLEGAAMAHAVLDGADLRSAHLQGVRALKASWLACDLRSADLRGVEFDQGHVTDALFDGADLRAASLVRVEGYLKASWIGVDMRDIDFTGAYLCRRFIMDQNYIEEFRRQTKYSEVIYRAWWITSDCGRSMVRWGACIGALVLVFAWMFTGVDVAYGDHETALSPIYYSVVTLTTLGYGDALPASPAAQVVAMVEVLFGYVMLGGLLSIISNKMVRRAE